MRTNMPEVLDPPLRVATGFEFTEGPVWDVRVGELFFSDMPGDTRRSFSPERGVRVVSSETNMANGMALDGHGRLVICEHATSSVVRIADGHREVLAEKYEGAELNSPNDIIVDSKGRILFTDPTFGRNEYYGVARTTELNHRGLYRIELDGSLTLLLGDFDQPNGLCFTPDETVLLVNDTARNCIRSVAFDSRGSVSSEGLFADGIGPESGRPGAPDGMKCDAAGNVYVTGPGGIWIYSADGRKVSELELPEVAANLAWGGADWQDLYITASTSLYRARLSIPGARVPGWLNGEQQSTDSGVAYEGGPNE